MKDFLLKRKVGLISIMVMVFLMLVLPVLFTNQNPARAVENGLARTPPMGWNCWNCFGININETTIREIADVMVSSGMKDAGYEYIIIDDGWQISRDSSGNIVADPVKFPNGIKTVADYVHSKGLKLGLYSDRGTATCCNKPGSLGYEEQDARTYAQWGIDYLKYDNCNADNSTMQVDYERMRDALATCGRPIVYSICAWWFYDWMPGCGNLWRTTTDISDNWSSVCKIIDLNQQWAKYAGPGQWNDPDMLEVGNGGMTDTEYRAHFSMWCIMAAPLITGNDLRNMSQVTLETLTNREVIAVDQDPAGIQGTRVVDNGDLEVWCKPLGSANGSAKAVALFNRSGATSTITVNWSDIGITGSAAVRDLWAKEDRGTYNGSYSATVPSHGVVMLKIVQTSATTPTPTPTVSPTWVPYVPSATQVALTADPENHLMNVDLTFPDGGYRIASEGEVAVAAGINPDGTTYLSNLTSGVRIEKYTGYSSAIVTTKRITYQIHYGDTTYFAFQVSGAKVKDITITKTPTSPTPTLPTFSPSPTPTVTAGTGISVSYVIQNDWGSGATVNVTIKNNGTAAVNGWALAWNFPGNQTISNLWNGILTQSGTTVTVKNASYNAVIAANGGTVNFGFNLSYSGKNVKPGGFTMNGTTCQIQ